MASHQVHMTAHAHAANSTHWGWGMTTAQVWGAHAHTVGHLPSLIRCNRMQHGGDVARSIQEWRGVEDAKDSEEP
eukprot:2757534-Alexandrium_andersonii.AAC.1